MVQPRQHQFQRHYYWKPDISIWSKSNNVVVITTAQLNSTKPELRFCASSNPARGVSEIRGGEDLWQWSRLEIKLNAFRRSTIPQKQFIIIIIIMIKFSPVFWILGKLNVFPIVIVNKGFNFRNSFWIMINIVMIQ